MKIWLSEFVGRHQLPGDDSVFQRVNDAFAAQVGFDVATQEGDPSPKTVVWRVVDRPCNRPFEDDGPRSIQSRHLQRPR